MSANPVPVQAPPQHVAPKPAALPPGPQSPRSRKPFLFVAIGLLAGGAAYYVSQSGQPEKPAAPVATVRTVRVAMGSLERTSRVAGVTAARNFANVIAPIVRGPESRGNLVLLQLVKSGSMVTKGQTIAQIDAQSVQDHVDDLQDTIESAEADVRKRRAEQAIDWETLQQTVKVAKAEFDKARLDAQPAEVKTDIERQLLKLALEEAEARYKQVQNDLRSKQQAHRAEIRILELTLERHKRHRDRHAGDLKRFTIQASMDGLAVMSPIFRGGDMGQVQQGDQVYPGMGFMKVVSPNSMQVEGMLNQAESSLYRIGQPARIKLDAYPEVELQGKVMSIGALATGGWRSSYYIRNVPIRISIDGRDPRLIPDLSASATILLDRAENQPLIPLGAVAEEQGKKYAFVKSGDGFEKRQIELGLENDLQAVVKSGLRAGDEVRIN